MSGLEIFLGITLGLLVNETCDLSPWAARRLVQWSARVRYTDPERAETRAAELVSVIEECPGKLFKLVLALTFFVQAILAILQRKVTSKKPRRILNNIPTYIVKFAVYIWRLEDDRKEEFLAEMFYPEEMRENIQLRLRYSIGLLFAASKIRVDDIITSIIRRILHGRTG